MCFKVISSQPSSSKDLDQTSPSAKPSASNLSPKDTSTKDTNSISSKDSKYMNNILVPPFTPVDSTQEKISSFKQVKVYYCDNLQSGRQIFQNDTNEEPTILHLESYQPRMKLIQKTNLITSNKTCTCSKTKCMKKYCECLANNQYCYNCNCVDCHNLPEYQNEKMKDNTESITCTCTKSNCNKKYCECYKTGKKCNDNCRCLNCLNKEKKEEFIIERISVFIDRGVIKIEKVVIEDKAEVKLLKQKRQREIFHTD